MNITYIKNNNNFNNKRYIKIYKNGIRLNK